jgi:hypothetical protein
MTRPGVRLTHDPGAQPGRVDPLTQSLDGTRELMSQDHRRVGLEVVVPDVEVGAADAGVADPDDDLPGSRLAQPDLAQL